MNMVSSGISMSGILKIGQPLAIVAVGAVAVVSTVDITPLKKTLVYYPRAIHFSSRIHCCFIF